MNEDLADLLKTYSQDCASGERNRHLLAQYFADTGRPCMAFPLPPWQSAS